MEFIVKGKPQGKARPRVVRNKYTGKTHGITPAKTIEYEDLIRWSYKSAGGQYMGEATLQLDVQAYFPIPKSFNRAKRQRAEIDELRPTTKPDCDNIIKVVLDALNGVAYYDDKQVVCVSCNKYYAETGYIKINIKEIEL